MTTKANIISNAANVATGLTAGSGMVNFINEHATVIGIVFTGSSFLLAFIFYILNYRLNKKGLKIKHESEIKKARKRIRREVIAASPDHKDELLRIIDSLDDRRLDDEVC